MFQSAEVVLGVFSWPPKGHTTPQAVLLAKESLLALSSSSVRAQ